MQRTHGFGVRPAAVSASHGSTTPARNSSRRSSVRCGKPSRCASARAPRTAAAEQLERDGDRLALGGERGDGRVDPAAHRDEGAVRVGVEPRVRAGGGAERAVQRVGGEVGRVELADAQAAELGGDRGAVDAGRLQQRRTLDELDRRARRGDRRAAAGGLESGVADPVLLDRHAQVDEVAAGRSAGHAGVPAGGLVRTPAGVTQVFCKSLVRHSQSSMRVSLSGRGSFHPMMGAQ